MLAPTNMKMRFRLRGGDLEYAVLANLQGLGLAQAREIHSQVREPRGLVYTTTAKALDRLHAKRLVGRERNGIDLCCTNCGAVVDTVCACATARLNPHVRLNPNDVVSPWIYSFRTYPWRFVVRKDRARDARSVASEEGTTDSSLPLINVISWPVC